MNNPMSLEGRVIMITGAAQGIGRGVALKAASLGATLVLIDLNEAMVLHVQNEQRFGCVLD